MTRLHERVVAQSVLWPTWGELKLGQSEQGPLWAVSWQGNEVRLRSLVEGAEPARLKVGDQQSWADGRGLRVDVNAVERAPLSRWPKDLGGDMGFLALLFATTVGVTQLEVLAETFKQVGGGGGSLTPEPSSDIIARLLERDFEGDDAGRLEIKDGPAEGVGIESFYMPAGSEGPTVRPGGGEVVGPRVVRSPKPEPETPEGAEAPSPPAAAQEQAPALALEGADPTVPEEGAVAEVEEVEAAPPSELPPGQLRPMERFVGWGFRDWFDVKDARPAAERKIARELEMVRRRLKIDPSDSAAINLLGYYAYLAENGDLSRDAFERLIELYPDEPTGYNNLALTYKRDKDYTREEALYRKALELEPGDTNVLNNLAVCLAHQGRYEEALKIMEDLEVSLPDDPYADLHRAKIHAEMGHELRALNYLKKSLSGVQKLDTMHHIELRQDIRLDPSFDSLRSDRRFHQIITEAYGVNAEELLRPRRRRFGG